MRTIGIGKTRSLQRVSTRNGHFTILALDHQEALRRALSPTFQRQVQDEDLENFKTQVTQTLAPEASGVLLDPVYGAAQAVAGGNLGKTGLLVELEHADYALQSPLLRCETLPGWSVAKIKRMGGDGVKLFYYYNADNPDHAGLQHGLLAQIASDCAEHDIPFYAEPILYALSGSASVDSAHVTRLVIAGAQQAEKLGADILKMEFPLGAASYGDTAIARSACEELSAATTVPWALLSAGVDFETFCGQVQIACAAGASGVIAGRAVWGEATRISNDSIRTAWLESIGRERMCRLAELVRSGPPWMARLRPEPVSPTWYSDYSGASVL